MSMSSDPDRAGGPRARPRRGRDLARVVARAGDTPGRLLGSAMGEHAALTADRVEPVQRRILVDRQVIETRHHLALSGPKNRRRRATMYPRAHPRALSWRAWARRSNYRRNVFDPAARAAGWPRRPDGRSVWTFRSLRHVFATWALSQPGARIEDVSRLMGHSSVRITQDVYVSPDGDLFERFYQLTK